MEEVSVCREINAARWGGTHGWRAYVPRTLDSKHESLKRILTGLNLIICLISGVNLGVGPQLDFIFAFAFLSLYHIRLPLSGQLSPHLMAVLPTTGRVQKPNSMELSFSIPRTLRCQDRTLIEYFLSPVRDLLLAGIMHVFIMGAKSKDTYNLIWILRINQAV